MKKLFYICMAVMLWSVGSNAQVSKDTVLLFETFEDTSTTLEDWAITAPSCTGKNWGIYTGTAVGANGSDQYVGFPSSSSASNCNQELHSPWITVNKKTTDDSVRVSFWIYRTSTNSNDFVNFYIFDGTSVLSGPVSVYQYNQKTPTTGTGWVQLFWNLSYNTLTTSSSLDFKVVILAVSGASVDLRIDDVKVHHIWKENAKPELEIIDPDENVLMTAGRTYYNIQWGYKGSTDITDPVKLEYTLDGGANWTTIGTTSGTSNKEPWNIPEEKTTQAQIRVTDANDASITATSDMFSIIWPIDLTSQNNGETYSVGTLVYIRWLKAKNVTGINIEFSPDGGANWILIEENVSASDGAYEWKVPNTLTSNAKIRLTDLDGSQLSDESEKPFKIIHGLQITSPNGGESLGLASQAVITWQNPGNIAKVKLAYTTNGTQWNDIAQDLTGSSGSYVWTVPSAPSNTVKVRIMSMTSSDVFDESDNVFSIIYALKVTSPNGTESVGSGYQVPIAWQNPGNISKVKLTFTTDGGSVWNDIATDIDGSAGTYTWVVPQSPSTTVKVRVADMTNGNVFDESDQYFSIYDASSIREIPDASGFTCFPNPSNGKFTVRAVQPLDERTTLQVMDLTGRIVYASQMAPGMKEMQVNIGGLKPGMYTLLFSDSKAATRKQIVIE